MASLNRNVRPLLRLLRTNEAFLDFKPQPMSSDIAIAWGFATQSPKWASSHATAPMLLVSRPHANHHKQVNLARLLHSAGWPPMQQQQHLQEQEAKLHREDQTKVVTHPSNPAASPFSASSSQPCKEVSGKQGNALMLDDFADAEECDEAMEDLEQTRRRVGRLSRPPPGQVSLSNRVKQGANATARLTKATLVFLTSVPGRMARFAALPRDERRAAYARWWGVVKKEAKHYWLGTKLLGKDVKIASRLVRKVLAGKSLSRRERQQLTRTTADIFRLVPMLVFVVIPFMELLLPVALKLFPNMLPSTFEDKLRKEEELKRRISARLEVARFLQDTVAEMAGDMTRDRHGDTQTSAAELYEFMKRVRAGEAVATSDLLKFAKLFNDELTLDNLERVQLVGQLRCVYVECFQ
jgi:LETM1 and EF-hand domain-containing protein 1, mitochondrial